MSQINVNFKYDPSTRMYLIVKDFLFKKYGDLIKTRTTDRFNDFVRAEVMNYVVDGVEPPAQIQTAIMNIADDMMAGRESVMRSGDYIALMGYAKEKKLL